MKSIIFAKKNGLWLRSPSGNTANTKSKNAVADFTLLSNVPSKIRRNSFVLLLARHRYRELRERGPTGLSINRDFQKPSSRNISESSVFENWPWHETWISDAKSMRASLTYSWQALTYPPLSWIKESSTNEYFTIARHCEIPIMKKKKICAEMRNTSFVSRLFFPSFPFFWSLFELDLIPISSLVFSPTFLYFFNHFPSLLFILLSFHEIKFAFHVFMDGKWKFYQLLYF